MPQKTLVLVTVVENGHAAFRTEPKLAPTVLRVASVEMVLPVREGWHGWHMGVRSEVTLKSSQKVGNKRVPNTLYITETPEQFWERVNEK